MNKQEFELRECIAITNQGIRYDQLKDHVRYVERGRGRYHWQIKIRGDWRWVLAVDARCRVRRIVGSARETRLTMLVLRENPIESAA